MSQYSKLRRITQFSFWAFLLCSLVKLIYFDYKTVSLHFFSIVISRESLFFIVLLIIALVIAVLIVSYHKGKIFCSWFCPMHGYLEYMKKYKSPVIQIIAGILIAMVLSEAILAFAIPLPHQIALIKELGFPNPLFYAFGILFSLSMTVFVIYGIQFCKNGCPYSMVQTLVQSDETITMQYRNTQNRCINCFACDKTCPYDLQTREECDSLYCSNCNRCHDACAKVLGKDKTLFHLTKPLDK